MTSGVCFLTGHANIASNQSLKCTAIDKINATKLFSKFVDPSGSEFNELMEHDDQENLQKIIVLYFHVTRFQNDPQLSSLKNVSCF